MAPPSFSSFPDLTSKSTASTSKQAKQSNPTASTSAASSSKRPRATDFLDQLDEELGIEGERESGNRAERGIGRETERKVKGKERDHRRKDTDDRRERKEGKRSKDRGGKDERYDLVKIPRSEVTKSTPTTEDPLFYTDFKGDDLNIRYGGLHKGDVPRYRRLGAGRVVGLNSGLRITKDTAYSGRGLMVDVSSSSKTPRYTDPRSARHINDKNVKHIAITSRQQARPAALGEDMMESDDDLFLPTSTDPSRYVPFITDEPARPETDGAFDFPQEEEPEEEDELFDIGVQGGRTFAEYLKEKNMDFDRRLRESPGDIEGWTEFVEFQDEIARSTFAGGAGNKRTLIQMERRSTSEIKLSILDRALGIPANKESEELLLLYLRAAAEVEEPTNVLGRWKEMLRNHPTLTGLWVEYISFRQTEWVNFEIRVVVEVYIEALKVIEDAGRRVGVDVDALEENSIYLLLRCCLMLRQAGFNERALAAFQAIIELNFFRPDVDESRGPNETEERWTTRVVDDLEVFWDGESPRVGESNSKGWRNTPDDADPPISPLPNPVGLDSNSLAEWAKTEERTTAEQPRPARTTDPGIDDDVDPFRCILFDDVKDLLFVLRSDRSKSLLADAFLNFLGLPFTPSASTRGTNYHTDSFVNSTLLERDGAREGFWPKAVDGNGKPFETFQGEAMEPERRGVIDSPFEIPFKGMPGGNETLFRSGRKDWFVLFGKGDLEGIDVEFVRSVFALLHPLVEDEQFTLSSFAFEAAVNVTSALKLAKGILRTNRQNLLLWDAYARLQRSRGKVSEARTVYVTSLSMARSFTEKEKLHIPLLWKSWAEMEWEEGNSLLALRVLVAATAVEEMDLDLLTKVDSEIRPPASQILRARQYYDSIMTSSFQPSSPFALNRRHLVYSCALFEYLSSSSNPLDAASKVFKEHLFRLSTFDSFDSDDAAASRAEMEEVFMDYAKILYRRAEEGSGWKPGLLRDVLEKAIALFPANEGFLSLFYHNELRTKIQNRVRRTLELSVLPEKIVTSQGWLFAIYAEAYLDARSNNVWGVRGLFDRAINHRRTKSSPSIWSLYIDFEVRNGEFDRAKALVYRAVQSSPWCKSLYLKPFSQPLRSIYTDAELRFYYSLLLEKGLRVRVELDNAVEEVGKVETEDLGEMEDSELMFSERRRLMPY